MEGTIFTLLSMLVIVVVILIAVLFSHSNVIEGLCIENRHLWRELSEDRERIQKLEEGSGPYEGSTY